MRLNEISRTSGAVDGAVSGLHDAQPGDIIEIGVEGHRNKFMSKIEKVGGQDRLMDMNGNIFNRNGMIYRRVSHPFLGMKGKIVSAKLVTQKQLDNDHEDRKIEFLNNKSWKDVDPETRDKVLSMLHVSFTSMQGMKDYK